MNNTLRIVSIRYILPLLSVCVSAWLVWSLSSAQGNIVSSIMIYVTGFLFLVALIQPKPAFIILVFLCAYLDLIKRLMVFDQYFNYWDITLVLGAAPVVAVGIYLGLIIRVLLGQKITLLQIKLFLFVALMLLGIYAFKYASTKQIFGTIVYSANISVYIPLVVVMSLLLRSREEISSLIKTIFLIFLPVAFYAYWQFIFGLADFEREYILSGYTRTLGNYLVDERERCPSTLNSHHTLTVVMAFLVILGIAQYRKQVMLGVRSSSKRWTVLLMVIFLMGGFCSLSRSGWFIALIGVLLSFVFTEKKRTFMFYSAAIFSYGLIFLNADSLIIFIHYVESQLPAGTPLLRQIFGLSTYEDRLKGFVNLMNQSHLWTSFGYVQDVENSMQFQYDEKVHDTFSTILIYSGVTGLISVILIIVIGLFILHREVFRLKDKEPQIWAVAFLSILFSMVAASALFGSFFEVFPNNVFFWMSAGCLVKIILDEKRVQERYPTTHDK